MKASTRCANFIKAHAGDVAAVILFIAIAFAYFLPADIEGRILYRHDSSAGRGAGQEQQEYFERTGERTRWTNALFSGMPTYQTAPSYDSMTLLAWLTNAYHLWLPENVWYVFVYLLGFYILLRAFDFRKELAVLGSIIWAFSSYFFIIIAAGHIWKVMALAYLPPMIAGMVYAFGRGKMLRGFVLTAVFSAFEVNANHVQMTYYFLFVILFMLIAYLVDAIRKRRLAQFAKAVAVCAAGAVIGICINMSNLYHTWQYGKESMRGGSELVSKNTDNHTATGLDRDYITQWSYGIGETWTLLVPNAKGGASLPLSMSDRAMKKADPDFVPVYQQMGQYWGEQPGTSGPVYVGAFVLMLAVLAMFIVRSPLKWAFFAAAILSILLAWGKNFMPFTDFFIDHIPMYSKFRTVASILVIAEFAIPMLAVMALKRIFDEPEILKQKERWVIVSFALTAGVCILFAIWPSLFFPDVISSSERAAMQGIPAEYLAPLTKNLEAMRRSVFTFDCWRSAIIIFIGIELLFLYRAKRLSLRVTACLVTLLCLLDMWAVNKRYLNDGMFVPKSQREQPQPMTDTDRQILADKTLDYRVLNLATNTFNENETSYYHKSIGGYHAAKLGRYQDVIDRYIRPEMSSLMPAIYSAGGNMAEVPGDTLFPILNALNTKYLILPLQDGQTLPLMNPYANGNAWFVDGVRYVGSAADEIAQIGGIDLRREAVADKSFAVVLGEETKAINSKSTDTLNLPEDTLNTVTLTSYEPNELVYSIRSAAGGIVIFSEIYYPGWTATVDGNSAPLARADYILRAMRIPAGDHEVVLTFKPQSIRTTETIAYTGYALLVLVLAGGIFFKIRRKKN
ncbi:MAG: YfhO family protein [Prevotella sp.]|nr:YfhO family protein [Prevotella sp.]